MPKKEITLKGIVAAINEVLKQLDETDKRKKVAYNREGIKKQLKGIKETVEGICSPDLSFPVPGDGES